MYFSPLICKSCILLCTLLMLWTACLSLFLGPPPCLYWYQLGSTLPLRHPTVCPWSPLSTKDLHHLATIPTLLCLVFRHRDRRTKVCQSRSHLLSSSSTGHACAYILPLKA